MAGLIDNPKFRRVVDAVPDHYPLLRLLRVCAKALFFRKRVIRGSRLCFAGVEDAVFQRRLELGSGRDEVLLRTLFTAVSPGTEKGYYLDEPNFHQPRPYIPGYSGCGRVRVVGRRAAGFRQDQRAAGIMKHSAYNVRAEVELVPVPEEVSSRDAAFVTLGVIALVGVRAAGRLEGEKVGVLGQGILGQMVNQMARAEGAGEVIALARGESKKGLAEKSGVDAFIALQHGEIDPGGMNLDLVIDITGSRQGFESALELVKPGGRVVMLGSIPRYAEESNWARAAVEKKVEVVGAHVRNLEAEGLSYRGEAARFLNLLAEKKVKLDHLITDTLQPASAPEVYRRLAAGERGIVGVVIDWQSL